MYFYKLEDGAYMSSITPMDDATEITEKEYYDAVSPTLTEEEERAKKEAQLSQLLRELYPDEYKEGK